MPHLGGVRERERPHLWGLRDLPLHWGLRDRDRPRLGGVRERAPRRGGVRERPPRRGGVRERSLREGGVRERDLASLFERERVLALFAGVPDRSRRDEGLGAALAGWEGSGEELERSRRWEPLDFSCLLGAGLSRSGEEEEESSSLSEPERDGWGEGAFRVVAGAEGAAPSDGLLGRSATGFFGGGEEERGDLVSLEGGRLWPDEALSRAGSGDGERRCGRGSRAEVGVGVDLRSGCRG